MEQATTVVNWPLFPLRSYRMPCGGCNSSYSIQGAKKLRCNVYQSLFHHWWMATSEMSNWYFLLAWSAPSFSSDQKVRVVFSDQIWACRREYEGCMQLYTSETAIGMMGKVIRPSHILSTLHLQRIVRSNTWSLFLFSQLSWEIKTGTIIFILQKRK